jgi:hypothetical protein
MASKKGLKTRILEIVERAKDGKITEPELKDKLRKDGFIFPRPTGTYFNTIRKLVEEGKLGKSPAIISSKASRKGATYRREIAVRVFNYIPHEGRSEINQILDDLGYDLEKRRFNRKLKKIGSSWISARLKKLSNALLDSSPPSSVADFLISASADERFWRQTIELKKCLIHAVENATKKNVVPFLEKMNEKKTVAWLENTTGMSLTKMEVVDILHKLKNSRCVNLILEDLKESDGELCEVYGERCAPVLARVFESFPERKSEVKLELSKILEKKVRILSPGGETPVPTRFRVAEAILERI